MEERGGGNPGRKDFTRSPWFTTLVTIAAAGTILLLGAGALYFLTQAGSEALAATTSVLVTTGLVGLVVMTYLVAVRWSLPGHDNGGGPATQPRPITVRPRVDPDTELLRILDDARLGDLSAPRRARMRDRRQGAT